MRRFTYAGSASELLERAQAAPDQWSESTLLLYERAANALSFENDERRAGDTFMQLVRLHAELAFSDDAPAPSPGSGTRSGQVPGSIQLLDRNQRRQHLRLAIDFAAQARRSFLFGNSISQLEATAAIVELRYHLGEREKATTDEIFLAQQHSVAGDTSAAADWYWRAARSGAKRAEDRPADPFESFEEPNSASFRNFNQSIMHLIRVGKYTGAASVALSMASTPKLIVQDQTRYYALACLCLIAAKLPEKVRQQPFMHGSKRFAGTECGQKLLSLAKACETRNFTEVNSALKKKRIHQLLPPSASEGAHNMLPQVTPVLEAIRYAYGTYTAKEAVPRGVAPATDSHDYQDPHTTEPTFHHEGKQRAPSVSESSVANSTYLSPTPTGPDSATASLLAASRADTPLSPHLQPQLQPQTQPPSIYRMTTPDESVLAHRANLAHVAAYASLPTPPTGGHAPPPSIPTLSRSTTGGSAGSGGSGSSLVQPRYAPPVYPASVPELGLGPSDASPDYDQPPPEFEAALASSQVVGGSSSLGSFGPPSGVTQHQSRDGGGVAYAPALPPTPGFPSGKRGGGGHGYMHAPAQDKSAGASSAPPPPPPLSSSTPRSPPPPPPHLPSQAQRKPQLPSQPPLPAVPIPSDPSTLATPLSPPIASRPAPPAPATSAPVPPPPATPVSAPSAPVSHAPAPALAPPTPAQADSAPLPQPETQLHAAPPSPSPPSPPATSASSAPAPAPAPAPASAPALAPSAAGGHTAHSASSSSSAAAPPPAYAPSANSKTSRLSHFLWAKDKEKR